MRIISKFRDYYDSIQAYGQDENVIYIRKSEDIIDGVDDILQNYYYRQEIDYLGRPTLYFENYYSNKYRGVDIISSFSIFFCGERFNAITTYYEKPDREYINIREVKIHYSKADLDEYIDALNIKDIEKKNKYQTNKGIKYIIDFFALQPAPNDIHFRLDTPIFVIRKLSEFKPNGRGGTYRNSVVGIEKNPDLSALDFPKVKDPYSAYQELDMFISGVMGGRSPVMAEISDEDMKSKKGFYEYSFKTRPQKKNQ